uniref:Uncharacterized protein n=1 Tax=Helianthus annuus TaxID=4232 RepID=A0A251UE02_HELAN
MVRLLFQGVWESEIFGVLTVAECRQIWCGVVAINDVPLIERTIRNNSKRVWNRHLPARIIAPCLGVLWNCSGC